mgnify:FL=1
MSNGDVIALDSSTSAYFLALELLDRRDLLVVTNSLRTAAVLSEESDATVVLLGGTVRRTSSSTVGDFGDTLAGRGRIQTAFVGVATLSTQRGLLELSVAEAESKRALVSTARSVVALFDSSKLEGFGMYPFVPADRVTRIVTDTDFPAEEQEAWRAAGTELSLCEVGSRGARAGAEDRASTEDRAS